MKFLLFYFQVFTKVRTHSPQSNDLSFTLFLIELSQNVSLNNEHKHRLQAMAIFFDFSSLRDSNTSQTNSGTPINCPVLRATLHLPMQGTLLFERTHQFRPWILLMSLRNQSIIFEPHRILMSCVTSNMSNTLKFVLE